MCNLSNTQCFAAWLPDMLQQCKQTFRTAAPGKIGSVRLPGHHGEMPEAYVYANISFTMLRLHWHSFILCLLLNNTLAPLQFPFSVLLWCSILPHHCTQNVNRQNRWAKAHQRSSPSSCFGMSRRCGWFSSISSVTVPLSIRTGQTLRSNVADWHPSSSISHQSSKWRVMHKLDYLLN